MFCLIMVGEENKGVEKSISNVRYFSPSTSNIFPFPISVIKHTSPQYPWSMNIHDPTSWHAKKFQEAGLEQVRSGSFDVST